MKKRHIAFSDGEMPPCENVGLFYRPVKWKPSNEPYRRMSPVIDKNTCKTCCKVVEAKRAALRLFRAAKKPRAHAPRAGRGR